MQRGQDTKKASLSPLVFEEFDLRRFISTRLGIFSGDQKVFTTQSSEKPRGD